MFHSASMPLPSPQSFISDEQSFAKPPRKLILFAWLIEGVAVSVSAALAAHPLLGTDMAVIERWLSAAPFLVIAFAELAKIPIVEAMFRLKGIVLPCIAVFATVLICLNTFYTVSNGFERAHAAKTQDIEAVKREIASIERDKHPIDSEGERLQTERKSLDDKLADINRREEKAEEHQRRICQDYAGQGRPCSTRLPEIYGKYSKEMEPINSAIKSIDIKLSMLNSSKLDSALTEAKARLNGSISTNQIYRFAAMIYGYDDPTKMTARQLNTFCFVWFGLIAFAVSTLGPLLAICYYRIKYQAEVSMSPWNHLLRAARRFLLRLARRNKIVKIQEVEKIIEKSIEVPVEVVKEIVRQVPVERVVTAVHELVREVPVDKVVPVETPVEVKVKELIYVPIFTNDPDLLKGQPA